MERDAMDGHIDDQATKAKYLRELDDVQAAIAQFKDKVR